MEYICKVEPSPSDDRDWNVANTNLNVTITDGIDYRQILKPVRNQGLQGSCAAQTAACMKEWQENVDYGFDDFMSPQFIYNNRINQDSEGMFGRDVMKILSKIGSVPESDYNYGKIERNTEIDDIFYEMADKHKIKGYARITVLDDLKKSLEKNGPCYIAFAVYNYGIKMWKPENSEQDLLGGHAMAVVGYNNLGFIIRNSWSEGWGDNGYCIYDYEDWGSHWEIWTTVDAETYIEPEDIELEEDEVVEPEEDEADEPEEDEVVEPEEDEVVEPEEDNDNIEDNDEIIRNDSFLSLYKKLCFIL